MKMKKHVYCEKPMARRWTAFGTGTMGDYNCHYMDPVSAALELGMPDTVEANPDPLYDPKTNQESYASTAEMVFHFPAKGKRPAMKIYWHVGGKPPLPEGWEIPEIKA